MARLVDVRGEWASAIGKAFVAFGSIEHTTVVCLREIPKDKFHRFAKNLKLIPRIDLLLEIVEAYDNSEILLLSEKLKEVKELAKIRNLIAHNPLVIEWLEDGNGNYSFRESIAAIHREGVEISLPETQIFAERADKLSSELLAATLAVLRALKERRTQ